MTTMVVSFVQRCSQVHDTMQGIFNDLQPAAMFLMGIGRYVARKLFKACL